MPSPPKPVVVVLLDKPQGEVESRLVEYYGDEATYAYSQNIVFVQTGDLPSEVRTRAGLNQQRGGTGAVFKVLGNFAGYTKPELWEWLQQTALARGR